MPYTTVDSIKKEESGSIPHKLERVLSILWMVPPLPTLVPVSHPMIHIYTNLAFYFGSNLEFNSLVSSVIFRRHILVQITDTIIFLKACS